MVDIHQKLIEGLVVVQILPQEVLVNPEDLPFDPFFHSLYLVPTDIRQLLAVLLPPPAVYFFEFLDEIFLPVLVYVLQQLEPLV